MAVQATASGGGSAPLTSCSLTHTAVTLKLNSFFPILYPYISFSSALFAPQNRVTRGIGRNLPLWNWTTLQDSHTSSVVVDGVSVKRGKRTFPICHFQVCWFLFTLPILLSQCLLHLSNGDRKEWTLTIHSQLPTINRVIRQKKKTFLHYLDTNSDLYLVCNDRSGAVPSAAAGLSLNCGCICQQRGGKPHWITSKCSTVMEFNNNNGT